MVCPTADSDRYTDAWTHTLSLLLHTHALQHIYTVLLSRFTSLSCPLSLTPFHAAVTGHFPTNLPHTCSLWQFTHVPETHSTHIQLWLVRSRHKIKIDPWLFATRFWSYFEWFIGEHYSKLLFCHNLTLPLNWLSSFVDVTSC